MAHYPVLHLHPGKIRIRKLLFQLTIFCIIFFVFASQLSSIDASLTALTQAHLATLGAALLAVCATFLAAAGTYSALSGFRHRYISILKVQIASGFANRLLPAGLGGMSLYTYYFRKNGYTVPNATALVASNTVLGICANIVLVTLVIAFNPHFLDRLDVPDYGFGLSLAMATIIIGATGVLYGCRKHRLAKYVFETMSSLRSGLTVNHRSLVAFLCNMSLTSLNVLALSLCVSSVSGSLAWPEALLVLSAGTLLGAVVPTPGGIGGVEAGLLAGMTAFGVPPASGFAAVFLYRGLTYWLPILPGYIAFHLLRRSYA